MERKPNRISQGIVLVQPRVVHAENQWRREERPALCLSAMTIRSSPFSIKDILARRDVGGSPGTMTTPAEELRAPRRHLRTGWENSILPKTLQPDPRALPGSDTCQEEGRARLREGERFSNYWPRKWSKTFKNQEGTNFFRETRRTWTKLMKSKQNSRLICACILFRCPRCKNEH